MNSLKILFIVVLFFSVTLFAQITVEEYQKEKQFLISKKFNLEDEILKLKNDIDSLRNLIPELEQNVILAYRELYVLKYDEEIGQRIASERIWKGMTDEMVRDGWGEPDQINNNVERWGTFTQWSYGNIIFFFRDGNLTDWEEGSIE